MSNRIFTNNFRSFNASQIIESVNESSNTTYYLFFGNHVPYTGGDSNTPTPNNSTRDVITYSYSNMIAGKRLTNSDLSHMVKRYDWAAGTVYDQYDDIAGNIDDLKYYVVTTTGANYYVFKCLFNNSGSASTIQPNFNDTSAQDNFFITSDGYHWKFLYSVEKSVFEKFATKDYMPVYVDSNVSGNAVSGSIDTILVLSGGQYYNNYYSGRFNNDGIRVGGDPKKYNIGNDASSLNNYYYNSLIYITGGTGQGQYKRIVGYDVLSTTKQITVDTAFSIPLDATSRYEITPYVSVSGNGTETNTVFARALVNSLSTNSIYSVEILSSGKGYLNANAIISVSPAITITNTATLRVILPPYGGHGFNPIKELNSRVLGISATFSNSESNTITIKNDYRTVGLLKDPLFSNVVLTLRKEDSTLGADGNFIDNEGVLQYRPYKLAGTVNAGNSKTANGTNTKFVDSFNVGDRILIKSSTSNFVANVTLVANDTSISFDANCPFTNTVSDIYKITVSATANVSSYSAGSLQLTNVSGILTNYSKIIGLRSYATANITSYVINNETKNFNTFNQLDKFYYDSVTGTFAEDETITQTSNLIGLVQDSTAKYHSIDTSNKILFVTNRFGIFNANSATGGSSGAKVDISSVIPGDIVPGSGEILYLEYTDPITRSATSSEKIKLLAEY